MSQCLAAPDDVQAGCLPHIERLTCYNQSSTAPGGPSRLICAARDGTEPALGMYSLLVTVTAILVPTSVVLNLIIVAVVIANRKLHTVINALATVLCANNIAWTALPVLMVINLDLSIPLLCYLRVFFFIITRGVSFMTIVIITLLRYLMVVKNHSYPASRKNVAAFVSIALLPSLVKWVLRRNYAASQCRCVEAWTPDGFVIIAKVEVFIDWLTAVIAISEYGIGVLILGFCYVSILVRFKISYHRSRRTSALINKSGSAAIAAGTEKSEAGSTNIFFKMMKHLRDILNNFFNCLHPPKLSQSLAKAVTTAYVVTFLIVREEPNQEVEENNCTVAIHRKEDNENDVTQTRRVACASSHLSTTQPSHENKLTAENKLESENQRCDSPPLSWEASSSYAAHHSNTKAPAENIATTSIAAADTILAGTAEAATATSARAGTVEPTQSDSSAHHAIQDPHNSPNATREEPIRRDGVLLQPLRLNAPTTSSGVRASTSVAPVPLGRRTSRPRGRIDIVASVSMSAFIAILFCSTFSYVLVGEMMNRNTECIVLAESRILFITLLILCTGAGAILNPLVIVLFSVDFRRAFWSTRDRVMRRITRNSFEPTSS